VFVVPRASAFYERVRTAVELNGNQSSFRLGGGWLWAEPRTCPRETELYDPWACNFLPISGCTGRHTGVLLGRSPYPEATKDMNYEAPTALLQPGFGADSGAAIAKEDRGMSIQGLRERYEDAPMHDHDEWLYSRFYTYLQVRP
jgi:hypothetical protein